MNWLEQLERELDQRLSAFLRNNPIQDQLFRDQHLQDRAASLKRQRQQLQKEAEEQRRQLLDLAADVRGWHDRTMRARQAGASDLASKAERHLSGLMEQGRSLWGDLGGSWPAVSRRWTASWKPSINSRKPPDPPQSNRTGRYSKPSRNWRS